MLSKNHPGLKTTSVVALSRSTVSSQFEASTLLSIHLFTPWQTSDCGYTITHQIYYSLQWLLSLEFMDYFRFWSKSSAFIGKCSLWETLLYVLDVRWNSPILWKCFSLWSALWTRHTSKLSTDKYQIPRGFDSACAELSKVQLYMAKSVFAAFYAQLATQGSPRLELSTIWLYLPPGLLRSWLAISIMRANKKDISAIKGLHFIYLYFPVRTLHWELKHFASTCTKRSAEQLASMHWYKNRFGFSSADTLL